MEKFSIEKELRKTKKHLENIEAGAVMGAISEEMNEVGKKKYEDEIAETKELGPGWLPEDWRVGDEHKNKLVNISFALDCMMRSKIPLKRASLEQLLAEVDVLKSIDNNSDVLVLRATIQDLLRSLDTKDKKY